ncbi:MAG: hypothetical protein EB149_07650, partial [Thaumarchaeota archaeon]|nr:hypothetical protein [Nitrososphaerota archaeon]
MLSMVTEPVTIANPEAIIKRVNTIMSLSNADEDCKRQSDTGNKMTYNETIYTKTQTIRKKTKKERLLAEPDVKRWY